jgi:hypothetical protein
VIKLKTEILELVGGKLVGVAGFEPATPSSRTRCATRLRYTPICAAGRYSVGAESRQARALIGPCGAAIVPRARFCACSGEVGTGSPIKNMRQSIIPGAWPVPKERAMLRPPMGRSQVVRQRILIPPFPGSNPGAPANQFGLCGVTSGCMRTADIPAG